MIRFEQDTYTDGLVTRVYSDGRYIATCIKQPSGCSVRWGYLDYPAPGWVEFFPSDTAARSAIEQWIAGLDIVPWDSSGPKPER